MEAVQEAFSRGTDQIKRAEDRKRRTEERERRRAAVRAERERKQPSRPAQQPSPVVRQSPSWTSSDTLPKRLPTRRAGGSDRRAQMTWRRRNIARKDFSVFKQVNERYRWVLISSSAYRDRDQEIVSQKALEGAVVVGDRTGYRGPLRWWHVPGLDIGDCDFQAMHGRFLIESGTFRDERIGAAVARKAHALQASIGFTHSPSDPDARGVFHHIAIFERSLVPIGRAANPLTQLVVKDTTMKPEQEVQFRELLKDEALAEKFLEAVSQRDKSAQESGLAFKESDPLLAELIELFERHKAAQPSPPVVEKAPPEETELEVEADTEEMSFLTTKEQRMIAEMTSDLVATKLAGMLDLPNQLKLITDKFTDQSKKKDDTIATLKEQQDKRSAMFERRLKALEGDQPKAFYRASEAAETAADEATVKSLGAPSADKENPFADMAQFLFGTPQAH